MKVMAFSTFVVLTLSAFCHLLTPLPTRAQADVSTVAASERIVGHWEGVITCEGKDWKMWLDVRAEGGALKGTADLPDYGLYALPVTITLSGSKAKISSLVRSSIVNLEGEINGEQMSGEWKGLNVTASFRLKRTQPRPSIYVEEEIRFQNGEATLVGTLVKPNTPGRHPAIIFTHGSGNQTRTQSFYRSRAYLFARHGVATLIYDRRGTGASKGGGDNATWINLAEDALAGLRALQSRPDINPRQIGISGFSQGGWVSPLAAARSKEVAFVLVGSTPGITPEAQNDYNVESSLRGLKVSAEEIAAVGALRQRVNQFLHTGQGEKSALEGEINKLRGEPWFRETLLPEKLEPYSPESRAYITFDPAPIWEKVTVPVLSLWGAQDTVVPAEKSRTIIERALKRAGNKDYTLEIFPKAGHGVGVIRDEGEAWDWPRLAPGYEKMKVEWLLKRVKLAK